MTAAHLRQAFRDRTVLVTGDTGFKGSWLAYWLHDLGARVVGYALPPQRADDHFVQLELDRLIEHVDGDIRDLDHLQDVFQHHRPEFVFHLAAQALVRLSYDAPKATFDTNVVGSVNVLECVRTCPSVRSLIYVTSDKCYQNNEWIWGYRENDRLGGKDPYSASKAAAELVFASYVDSYFSQRPGFGAASVRAGNVIGGGDWAADRIVPDSIKALTQGVPIVLRNPSSTRPWQHVLEPLGGYLLLATKLAEDPGAYSGPWNFGPSGEAVKTVADLTRCMVEFWGEGSVDAVGAAGVHEARLLHLNCDKARHVLGWEPRWDFLRTVRETVAWYRDVAAGAPARGVTRKQIYAYMEQT